MPPFMPHGECFLWQSNVLALHIISDALIALAYFSIPFALVVLARRRPDVPFAKLLWMFSTFIVSCGITHILSIVVIWYPIYWFEGFVKAFTGIVSITTAIALWGLLPLALTILSPDEVSRLTQRLQDALALSEHSQKRYERERFIAQTLQHASLGEIPRSIGSLEISAVYQPGVSDIEIGGDWYDAFQLSDGRVVVSIGDAAGKGLSASIIMSKMRQAIRVSAHVAGTPKAMLDAADRALRLEYPDQFVTAFVGLIDTTKNTLIYASAGHPAPLLRLPDGALVQLKTGGLPLGLRDLETGSQDNTTSLPRGSLLVLYTDGLTESTHDYVESTHDYVEGEARLRDTLSNRAVGLGHNPAREIRESVLAQGIRDDVAVLTVRNGQNPENGARWTFFVGDADAAYAVRDAVLVLLEANGANSEEMFASEIVFSELIGNVARYAAGPVDVRLDWLSDHPVLHVLDRGLGFRYDEKAAQGSPHAESGRGLHIVRSLSDEFTVMPRTEGGTHARVVLTLIKRQR